MHCVPGGESNGPGSRTASRCGSVRARISRGPVTSSGGVSKQADPERQGRLPHQLSMRQPPSSVFWPVCRGVSLSLFGPVLRSRTCASATANLGASYRPLSPAPPRSRPIARSVPLRAPRALADYRGTGPNWHHIRAERIYASLWRSLPSTASPPGDRPVVVDRRPRYHAGFQREKASCTSRGAWASAARSAPAGVTWGRWTMTSKASRGLRSE